MVIDRVRLSLRHRIAAALIALSGWAATGCAAYRCFYLTGHIWAAAVLLFTEYLTHWAVVLTAITFSIITVSAAWPRSYWWVGQAVIINVSMVIGYWSGSTWLEYSQQLAYLRFLHGPFPFFVIVYWFSNRNDRRLTIADPALWLLAPLIYTSWMELYGLLTGQYPYQPLDPFHEGRIKTLFAIIRIFIYTGVISYCLYGVDQLIQANRMRSGKLGQP